MKNWTTEEKQLMLNINNHFHTLCNDTNFVNRIGTENNWEFSYTVRAIEEYKKFLFIYANCGHAVSPAHPIDIVWHTHILYTRNYFEELPKILGKILHHEPETGRKSKAEVEMLQDYYSLTLENYRLYFGEEPKDIWTLEIKKNYSVVEEKIPVDEMAGVLYISLAPLAICVLSFVSVFLLVTNQIVLGLVLTTVNIALITLSLSSWLSKKEKAKSEKLQKLKDENNSTRYASSLAAEQNRYSPSKGSYASQKREAESKYVSSRSNNSRTTTTEHITEVHHDSGDDLLNTYIAMEAIRSFSTPDTTPSCSSKSSCSSCVSSSPSSSPSSSCSSSSSSSSSSCSSSSSSSSSSSCSSSSCSSGSSCSSCSS